MGFGAGGQIYGVGFSFSNPTSPGEFFAINPTTAAATDLGPLTFSPIGGGGNGALFALDVTTPSASLYAINPPSNASNFIGTVPFSSDGLVAIDSKGNLFAPGNGDGSFFKVSTTDASSTLIGNTGLGNSLYSGTFVGSTLYGFAANGSNGSTIVTIDTSNADIMTGASVVLPQNFQVVAAATSVPEPTSLVLGLIGGISVLTYGLRMRKNRRIKLSS